MSAVNAIAGQPSALGVSKLRVLVAETPGANAPWPPLGAGTSDAEFKFERCSADALDRQLDSDETARACLIVDSPVSALARALADGSEAECQTLLDAWCAAARRLLQRVMAQPTRCLCGHVDEIQRATPAWHQALARFLGVHPVKAASAGDRPGPGPNALDELVAQAIVSQHAEAAALFDQLLACCVVLDVPDRLESAPLAAADALRELRMAVATLQGDDSRARAGAAGPDVEALRAETHETLDRLFTTQADLEAALNEREALRRELDKTQAEARKVLERMAVEQVAQEAMSTERDALRRELDAVKGQNHEQARQLRESLDEAQAESRAAAAAARQEADNLLESLHEAHEQLSRYYLDARALRSVPAVLAHGNGPIIGATGVHLAGEHVEGRHLHLDLQLRDVHFDRRRSPDARLRLVEHLGRPGLALFSASPAARWLSSWETSGQEGETEYMLIVPGDAAGQAALARLGRTDWQVVADLSGLVLRGTLEGGSARWAIVARRLCRELAAIPVRLRYDQLDVEHEGSVVRARFSKVMFGALEWPSVTVQWTPVGASGRLELLAGADDTFLPLARWPADTSADTATDRWNIPVGAGITGRNKRHAWSALPEVDRKFLFALLDALPAVEGRAPAAAATHLAIASRALLREAHALSKSLARRQLLRRLLARITSR